MHIFNDLSGFRGRLHGRGHVFVKTKSGVLGVPWTKGIFWVVEVNKRLVSNTEGGNFNFNYCERTNNRG